MKKAVLILFTFICMASCDDNIAKPEKRVAGDKWIVEEKSYGTYMLADKRYLDISEVGYPTNMRTIEVGHHTFENIEVGDTITWNDEK